MNKTKDNSRSNAMPQNGYKLKNNQTQSTQTPPQHLQTPFPQHFPPHFNHQSHCTTDLAVLGNVIFELFADLFGGESVILNAVDMNFFGVVLFLHLAALLVAVLQISVEGCLVALRERHAGLMKRKEMNRAQDETMLERTERCL